MKAKECQSLFLHHNSQIIRFFEHNVDHKKGRVIRHTIPKIGISVSSDDKKDKAHFNWKIKVMVWPSTFVDA